MLIKSEPVGPSWSWSSSHTALSLELWKTAAQVCNAAYGKTSREPVLGEALQRTQGASRNVCPRRGVSVLLLGMVGIRWPEGKITPPCRLLQNSTGLISRQT